MVDLLLDLGANTTIGCRQREESHITHAAANSRKCGDKKQGVASKDLPTKRGQQRARINALNYTNRYVTEAALLKVSWWLILSSIWVPTQQSDIYSKKRAKSLTAHETVENAAIENKESYRNIC